MRARIAASSSSRRPSMRLTSVVPKSRATGVLAEPSPHPAATLNRLCHRPVLFEAELGPGQREFEDHGFVRRRVDDEDLFTRDSEAVGAFNLSFGRGNRFF
jgi:hypothetical protein